MTRWSFLRAAKGCLPSHPQVKVACYVFILMMCEDREGVPCPKVEVISTKVEWSLISAWLIRIKTNEKVIALQEHRRCHITAVHCSALQCTASWLPNSTYSDFHDFAFVFVSWVGGGNPPWAEAKCLGLHRGQKKARQGWFLFKIGFLCAWKGSNCKIYDIKGLKTHQNC